MKKLHTLSHQDWSQAGLLKEILAVEGIACLIRNEQLSAAIGELPFTECFPELWVIDDEVFPRAKLLLAAWLKIPERPLQGWVCPNCGEELEGNFGACWSCGQERE